MMFVDFPQEGRPVVRCLSGAGPVPEACSSYRSEIGVEVGKKEGVHNVHTLGFGSGGTGCGLARIGDVFGGVADILGLEPGSSPTSGTCFPCSGAWWPLSVHKLFTYGPLRGPFCCLAVTVAGGSFSWFRAAVALLTRSWPGVPPAA